MNSQALTCPLHPLTALSPSERNRLSCKSCGTQFPVVDEVSSFFGHTQVSETLDDAQQAQAMDRLWPALCTEPPSIVAISEYDAIRTAVGNCAGLDVLDLGCGTGQPVTTFARARAVFAVDFSMQALSGYRTPPATRVVKVHATALRLPFSDGMFDVVVAAQLLSHLGREQRSGALKQIARVVKPGGKVVLTALHYNFRFPKLGMAKSGSIDGVYFFRHTVDEFQAEIGHQLQLKSLWGVWNYLPKTFRLFMRLGRKTLYWDRLVRRTPLSLRYGKRLVAICSRGT